MAKTLSGRTVAFAVFFAVSVVRSLFGDRKPVAAICHAPWTLSEADVVRDH